MANPKRTYSVAEIIAAINAVDDSIDPIPDDTTTDHLLFELDVVFDRDPHEDDAEARTATLDSMVEGLVADYMIVQEAGPGGGWPVVIFSVHKGAALDLLGRWDAELAASAAKVIAG